MKIALIAIGDEVLYGYTPNTNASFISKALLQEGFEVSIHEVVGDNPNEMKKVVQNALHNYEITIITGGLGPTVDDLTRPIIAELFEVPIVFNEKVFKSLKTRFDDRGTLHNQAELPEGATILENRLGTASGLLLKNEKLFKGASLFALPGVPAEMKELIKTQVIPLLKTLEVPEVREYIYPLHFFELFEADVNPTLQKLEKEYRDISFGIYPAFGTLTVHIKATSKTQDEFFKKINKPLNTLLEKFQAFRYESPTGRLDEAVHLFLSEHELTIATAESCTGGSLASRFTTYPGASRYYKGSVVAYANDIKVKLLNVEDDLLIEKGAVSEEVTEEMAKSALKLFDVDIAIGVSGILGPTGGSIEKPVGTICATIAFPHIHHSWTMHFQGSREIILERCIQVS